MANSRKPAISVAVALLTPLLSVPVFNQVDSVRPDSFVRVTRVGGPRKNIVTDGPMLTFECWDYVSAEGLAMKVADLLEDSPGSFVTYTDDDGNPQDAWISSWEEVGAPTQHPDPDVDYQDRWVLTARLGISTNI